MAENESQALNCSLLGSMRFFAALLTALAVAPISAAEINLKSAPNGQPLFPKDQFQLQCWQEGVQVIHETDLRTQTAAPELSDQLLSFSQGAAKDKVMLVTIGQTLCMIKTKN